MITIRQFARMLLIRRWPALAAGVAVLAGGAAYVLQQPRQYSAEALLVLDVRPDPVLGGLGTVATMATQLEILKSEMTAIRAVQILGLDRKEDSRRDWMRATRGEVPIERWLAGGLQRGLAVDAVRNSNVISIGYTTSDRTLATPVANAFAQAATDSALEMRVAPVRESAEWFNSQSGALRAALEKAQSTLSNFQRDNGIVSSDEKFSHEIARLAALEQQLVIAQAERLDAAGRARGAAAAEADPGPSTLAQGLAAQVATAEAKLAEVDNVLGSGHPQRLQLQAQIASLKQQLADEQRRASGGSQAISRASAAKVEELRQMVEAQKRQVLSLRSLQDRMAVLQRDVETAQRAYETASQRASQLALEARANQASVRLLNAAGQEKDESRRKLTMGVVATVLAALGAAAATAVGLELRERRVRSADDLLVDALVPLLGVLQPVGSTRPVFRRLPLDGPLPHRSAPALPKALP